MSYNEYVYGNGVTLNHNAEFVRIGGQYLHTIDNYLTPADAKVSSRRFPLSLVQVISDQIFKENMSRAAQLPNISLLLTSKINGILCMSNSDKRTHTIRKKNINNIFVIVF